MKLAICLWNFEPTEETIDALRVSGVSALEPGAVFLTQHDQATIEAVGGWCRAAGIDVYVCHAPFVGANDLSLLDEDARQQAVANAKDSLARAAWMGAECVVIHPSGGDIETEKRERHGERLRKWIRFPLVDRSAAVERRRMGRHAARGGSPLFHRAVGRAIGRHTDPRRVPAMWSLLLWHARELVLRL